MFPGKSECPPQQFRSFTPSSQHLPDHCLPSISLLTPWAAKLLYAWHLHLHHRRNQLEADLAWFTKQGTALKSGLAPPLIICGFQIVCTLCLSMQIEKCTCHMLRTQCNASLRLVELNILVKATVTIPVPRPKSGLGAPSERPAYGYNAKNAYRRQKLEVKVDELVKISPFQLAIKVAVPFLLLFKGDFVYHRQFHETHPSPHLCW